MVVHACIYLHNSIMAMEYTSIMPLSLVFVSCAESCHITVFRSKLQCSYERCWLAYGQNSAQNGGAGPRTWLSWSVSQHKLSSRTRRDTASTRSRTSVNWLAEAECRVEAQAAACRCKVGPGCVPCTDPSSRRCMVRNRQRRRAVVVGAICLAVLPPGDETERAWAIVGLFSFCSLARKLR